MLNENELTMEQILNFCVPYKDDLFLSYITILEMQKGKNNKEKAETELVQAINKKIMLLCEEVKLSDSTLLNARIKISNDNVSKKFFEIDVYHLMNGFLRYLSITKDQFTFIYGQDIDEQIKVLKKDYLKPLKTFIKINKDNLDIIKERFPSHYNDYYKIAVDRIKGKMPMDKSFANLRKLSEKYIMSSFPDYLLNSLTQYSLHMKQIIDELSKPISMELFDKVDKSKLLLYINKLLLEKCKESEKITGKIDNKIYSIINYVEHKEVTGNNTSLCITCNNKSFEENPISYMYTYKDFLKEYQIYINNHPELKLKKVDLDYFDNYTFDEVNEFIDTFFNEETLYDQENWVIFPNGENNGINKTNNNESKTVKEAKENFLAIQKRSYFSNTSKQPMYIILGLNKFKDHVGYVYDNGYIVWELFDKKTDEISSKSGAIYIMDIHNFKEFSKMSKTDIIKYIKENPNGKIKRFYHCNDWQSKVSIYIDAIKEYDSYEISETVKSQSDDVKKYVKKIS